MNSVLLAAYIDEASKKSVLTDPHFFSPKNHNSIQVLVHMVHELFLSINIGLTAVKLFIGNLTLFSFQFTFRVWKRGN